MKVVLFGCGRIGQEALNTLGEEYVECFCDNNKEIVGSLEYKRPVISFEELKKNKKKAIVILCAGKKNAQLAKQCEENGITDYVIYESVKKSADSDDSVMSVIEDQMSRARSRTQLWVNKANELKAQVDYLRSHADIRSMRPAEGKLRELQLKIVNVAATIFKEVEKINIKPFLISGNLLGYVRHGGFIPWDDDMDFGLIREDYEKLREYCSKTFPKQSECMDQINSGELQGYFWRDSFYDIAIGTVLEDGKIWDIDIFPFDYYDDEYEYEDFRSYTKEIGKELVLEPSAEGKKKIVKTAIKENGHVVKKSKHIYFGMDSLCNMMTYHRGKWMPEDVLFPLQRIVFEGKEFWIPNNPEEFSNYEYPDIWSFPDDVGLPKHDLI